MAEYICCRSCKEPDCRGCNMYILEKALKKRQFERLKDNSNTIHITTDVQPVVHGRWIKNDGRIGWHCSVCKTDDNYAYSWNGEVGKDEFQDNFCPNCGSMMVNDDDNKPN